MLVRVSLGPDGVLAPVGDAPPLPWLALNLLWPEGGQGAQLKLAGHWTAARDNGWGVPKWHVVRARSACRRAFVLVAAHVCIGSPLSFTRVCCLCVGILRVCCLCVGMLRVCVCAFLGGLFVCCDGAGRQPVRAFGRGAEHQRPALVGGGASEQVPAEAPAGLPGAEQSRSQRQRQRQRRVNKTETETVQKESRFQRHSGVVQAQNSAHMSNGGVWSVAQVSRGGHPARVDVFPTGYMEVLQSFDGPDWVSLSGVHFVVDPVDTAVKKSFAKTRFAERPPRRRRGFRVAAAAAARGAPAADT